MLSKVKKQVESIQFKKQLPRDNKMYYINEGNNLNPHGGSLFDQLPFLDLVPKNTKVTALLNGSIDPALF